MMEAASRSNTSSLTSATALGAQVFLVMVTSAPCFVFFIINSTILYILRSKPMFTESPRYVLLFNLIFADTLLMAQAQALYLLAAFYIRMSNTVCVLISMISYLTFQISPLTLTVMSVERYIAVCFPFRHSTVVTLRNTGFGILLIWIQSCVDVLTRFLLLVQSLQRPTSTLCINIGVPTDSKFKDYNTVYTCILFVFSGLIITSSFICVMVVARSASADKSSANKARNTLLLHLFQLSLNLLSVVNVPLFDAASKGADPVTVGRLYAVIYVLVILSPRCLSALTYGLRDQSIRRGLMSHLCCSFRLHMCLLCVQVDSQGALKGH